MSENRFRSLVRGALKAATVLLGFLLALPTLAVTTEVDVSGQVTVIKSGLVLNRSTNTFDSTVTLTNSLMTINGPVRLILPSITPSGITLFNATGSNQAGQPYIDVPVSGGTLAPGQSMKTVLKFSNPKRVTFGFTTQVMANVDIGDAMPLPGIRTAPAIDAMVDMTPQPAEPGDIVNGLILTRLDVVIAADATVGQVNDALNAIDGSIVAMRAGFPIMTVSIPRQDGPDALRAVAERLAAQPGIRIVFPGRELTSTVAPDAPANEPANFSYLDAARFPAAWNARKAARGLCVNDRIPVVVIDSFHRPIDALYAQFDNQLPMVTHLGAGSPKPSDHGGYHGYNVLTTLAAKLDATVPTGANPFPECLDIRAVQLEGLTPFDTVFAIDAAVAATNGNTVVNASFGFNDKCGGDTGVCTPEDTWPPTAFQRAVAGAVQRALLEPVNERVVVTSTAGNEADEPIAGVYPGTGLAGFNSPLNVAASADSAMSFVSESNLWEPPACTPAPCFPTLVATAEELSTLSVLLAELAGLGQPLAPPAGNVLIVGSSDNVFYNPSDFSDPVAHVYAVGEGIPTLLGVPVDGTSFAAPQVAGLVSYLWMLSPDLRSQPVQNTMAAIKENATVFPAGMIDAYATVLSLDEAALPTSATAPVRLAILDWDDDGVFDEADLGAFLFAYTESSGDPVEPTTPDYSRLDLNGDGYTGGTHTARFDLDRVSSTQYGAASYTAVEQQIANRPVTFYEDKLTDMQVLCYYAYSALYTGDTKDRDQSLDQKCESWAVIKRDATHMGWLRYDADENLLCCSDYVLAADTRPPLSAGVGDGAFSVSEPSANTLAIDFSGSSMDAPLDDSSSGGTAFVEVELTFGGAGTLQIDINPAFLNDDAQAWWTLSSGETATCNGLSASTTCQITIDQRDTRLLDISVGLHARSSRSVSVGGRAVTVQFTPAVSPNAVVSAMAKESVTTVSFAGRSE